MKLWKSFRYKFTTLFFFSLILALFLYQYAPFHTVLLGFGDAGYFGAFFAGIFFVLSFTVATSLVVLLVLSERLSPLEVALLAGFGAVIGDYIVFRFVQDQFAEEIIPLYHRFGGRYITAFLQRKYFRWVLPVIGAIIIASPFPDELGVALLGVSKMKSYQFLILTFVLNTVGIFLVLYYFKP